MLHGQSVSQSLQRKVVAGCEFLHAKRFGVVAKRIDVVSIVVTLRELDVATEFEYASSNNKQGFRQFALTNNDGIRRELA